MYPYFSNNNISKKEIKTSSYEKTDSDNDIDNQEEFENCILDMILDAIEESNEDSRYYEKLSTMVKDENDKASLRKIHLEDMKHFNMLSDLYTSLTGREPNFEIDEIEIEGSLADEFLEGAEDKLENVELYRNIMMAFLDIGIRDMIFEIITDEQNHAQKLNQLYYKYK
ncbi:MAG: ferritin-like domain-containing protein [Eubacteriales bacterium]|nr:ferritin-like domain-containing protein [Eubacteriales bacterium]